jgi:hypothetical protein
MGPELHYDLIAQQRGAEMRQEGGRQRLATEVAAGQRRGGWRSRVAQLFAWRGDARANGDYEEGAATAGSERLTHLA